MISPFWRAQGEIFAIRLKNVVGYVATGDGKKNPMLNEEFIYVLLYRCSKCRGPISHMLKSSEPRLPDSEMRAAVGQVELWCEDAKCGWHGPAGELQLVSKHLCKWIP